MQLRVFSLAAALALAACHAPPPEPHSVRDQVASAREVQIVVYRAGGGSYEPVELVEPEEIARLAQLFEFEGGSRRRSPGKLATTVAVDLRLSSEGSEPQELLLRADLVWFGPGHRYEVELASDGLYRHVRELVGDPWPH